MCGYRVLEEKSWRLLDLPERATDRERAAVSG
jgi:hypothetical protein